MKNRVRALSAAVACFCALAGTNAAGQTRMQVEPSERRLIEAGVQVGYPTGFSFKFWLNEARAIDVGVGRNFTATGNVAYADYLWHTGSLVGNAQDFRLPVYIGAGGRWIHFNGGDDNGFGPRMPVGIEAILKRRPFSFFAEIAPTVEFRKDTTTVTADSDFGARLVF